MSRSQPESGRGAADRSRTLLAGAAALLLAISFALLLTDRGHPRRLPHGPGQTAASLAQLATRVQASIAQQQQQVIEQQAQVDRHQLARADEEPPPSQIKRIGLVDRVLRRWLSGYLPYEVGRLTVSRRLAIIATSTPQLAQGLLSHPPDIPPRQQQTPPPQGRLLGLSTTIDAGGTQAQTQVEVAYGLEQIAFQVTLTARGAGRWLVAAFNG